MRARACVPACVLVCVCVGQHVPKLSCHFDAKAVLVAFDFQPSDLLHQRRLKDSSNMMREQICAVASASHQPYLQG